MSEWCSYVIIYITETLVRLVSFICRIEIVSKQVDTVCQLYFKSVGKIGKNYILINTIQIYKYF